MEKLKQLYKNMTTRERLFFYGAVAAAVIMLTDLMVLNPILSHIKVLDAEILAKTQGIQRDLRILSFEKSILKEYARYERFLDSGVKTQEEIIASLLRKLETLAAEYEIKITNVTPGEIENKPIYKIYKTTFEFEGPLQQTLMFMNQLEESDNLFQIIRYQLAPKTKTGQIMRCNMEVERILITAEDMSLFHEAMENVKASKMEASVPKAASAVRDGRIATTMDTALPEPI